MDNKERVIEKILKIFELAKNNPNKEEAAAAAAKAQKLLAQYHIEMSDLDDIDCNNANAIVEEEYVTGNGNKWKYGLAAIVARNFRSKIFRRGTSKIVFYGFTTDTIAARNTFEFLFSTGNLLAQREYTKARKEGRSTHYLKNTYLDGFMHGVANVLDKQCTALMIVTPPEVEAAWANKSNKMKTSRSTLTTTVNRDIWNRGYDNGRDAMGAKSLT